MPKYGDRGPQDDGPAVTQLERKDRLEIEWQRFLYDLGLGISTDGTLPEAAAMPVTNSRANCQV